MSNEKVPTYNLVLNDGLDSNELVGLGKLVQEQGGKVMEFSQLTASITVGFPPESKPKILEGGPTYTVEKSTEVEAKFVQALVGLCMVPVVIAAAYPIYSDPSVLN